MEQILKVAVNIGELINLEGILKSWGLEGACPFFFLGMSWDVDGKK